MHVEIKLCKHHCSFEHVGGVDKMTYPLYLTHYMFLKEPFEIVFSQNSFVQLFAFVVLSLTTAFVLKGVSKIFLERFS